MDETEKKAVGHLLVTLVNRINAQDIIIEELVAEMATIKMFIQGMVSTCSIGDLGDAPFKEN